MKSKIFITLIFISSIIYSQTEQLEKENLTKRLETGELTKSKFQTYGVYWLDMIEEIGGYPELPYDEKSKQIKFKWIQETEQSKKTNFNRIIEWSAITFGSLSNVLHYKDFDSGKIVIKGWFDVTHLDEYKNFWGKSLEGFKTTKCYQTYVFTIKDDVIKIEVGNVYYRYQTYGYTSDGTIDVSIHSIYPITNFENTEWKEKLSLIEQTGNSIGTLVNNLFLYIEDYGNDYKF